MRKYTLTILFAFFIALFSLIFYSSSVRAYDSGCTSAGPFSVTTGQYCYGSSYGAQNIGYSQYQYSQYSQYQPQYQSQYQYQPQAQASYSFGQGLAFGSRGADVAALQQMLSDRGYSAGRIDGIFGGRTRNAVINFQLDNGLSPTGVADAQTLAILNSSVYLTTASSPYYPAYFYPIPAYSYPTPYVTPYAYPTPVNYNQPPVISGVSGPQSLSVSQQGTWTVSASNLASSAYGGNLTYSVNWGDQPIYAYGTNNSYSSPQQSASFTHTYYQAGTYRPTFTVTNQSGQSAETSLTVVVGGGSSTIPYISYLSPSSGGVGNQVTVNGSGFGYSNNTVYFGSYTIQNIYSFNGTSLTFTVPQTGAFNCFTYPCSQNFLVSVNNSYSTSNQVNFVVNH